MAPFSSFVQSHAVGKKAAFPLPPKTHKYMCRRQFLIGLYVSFFVLAFEAKKIT